MRSALIVIFLWLVIQNVSSNLTIDPSNQAKVEKGIETANGVAEDVKNVLDEQLKQFEDATEPLRDLKYLQNSAKFLGSMSKLLGPAGTIASFVFTFFADSEFDKLNNLITKEFKKVNSKLDGIYDQFGILEENLKDFISADTDTNNLVLYANKILNSQKKFTEMVDDLETLTLDYDPKTSPRRKLKILERFRDHYKLSGVDNAIQDFIRLTDTNELRPILRKDIFSSVREAIKCDSNQLMLLHFYIQNILLIAAKQKMAYDIIDKGLGNDPTKDVSGWFYILYKSYQKTYLHCHNNVKDYAEKIALEGGSPEQISTNLKQHFPWLHWAVGKFADEETDTDKYCHRTKQSFQPNFIGTNYLEFQNKQNEKLFLLWQDEGIDYTVSEYEFASFDFYEANFTMEGDNNTVVDWKRNITPSKGKRYDKLHITERQNDSLKTCIVHYEKGIQKRDWCFSVVQKTDAKTMSDLCGPNICASCASLDKNPDQILVGKNGLLDEPYSLYSLHNEEYGTTAKFLGSSFSPPEMLHGSNEFFCYNKDEFQFTQYTDLIQSFPELNGIHRVEHDTDKSLLDMPWDEACDEEHNWHWITAFNPRIEDPCSIAYVQHKEASGECYNIKYTSNHTWICNEGYGGDNCEEELKADGGQICEDKNSDTCAGLDYLKSSLEEFPKWEGLATLIDVWVEVVDLADKITKTVESATGKILFHIDHQDTIKDAAVLLRIHHKYNFGNDSEEYFMLQVHEFLNKHTLTEFLTDFDAYVRSNNLQFVKQGLIDKYGQDSVCSQAYRQELATFKKEIKNMIAVVTQTLLKYNRYKLYRDEDHWHERERDIKYLQQQSLSKEYSCPQIVWGKDKILNSTLEETEDESSIDDFLSSLGLGTNENESGTPSLVEDVSSVEDGLLSSNESLTSVVDGFLSSNESLTSVVDSFLSSNDSLASVVDGFLSSNESLTSLIDSIPSIGSWWGRDGRSAEDIEGYADNSCDDTDTFEGAEVKFQCLYDDYSYPNIESATCIRKNGKLDWSVKEFECLPPSWGTWSSWSSCKTDCSCSGRDCLGTRKRTRKCIGRGKTAIASNHCLTDEMGDEEVRSFTCKNIDCCKRNGKFTCNSGKCITKSWLCDGEDDCPGGEDEVDARCPNAIRSHNGWVGFENQCKSDCDAGPDCFITAYEDDYSWMRGHFKSNEQFRIIAKRRRKNAAIQDGDTIGFYWGKGHWFSCDCERNGNCQGRTCPGSEDSPNFGSNCKSEVFKIYKRYGTGIIEKDDEVYLKRMWCSKYHYVTGKDGTYVQTTDHKGSCEYWKIYKY